MKTIGNACDAGKSCGLRFTYLIQSISHRVLIHKQPFTKLHQIIHLLPVTLWVLYGDNNSNNDKVNIKCFFRLVTQTALSEQKQACNQTTLKHGS